MTKSIILVFIVFGAILAFLLANTFLNSLKRPTIVLTTPKVVIQQPATTHMVTKQVVVRTVVVKEKSHKGLLKKLAGFIVGNK